MNNYVSGIIDMVGTSHSYLVLIYNSFYDDKVICKLELNGSGQYEDYTIRMIQRLVDSGCDGVVYNAEKCYTIYRTNKLGISLMRYLKCCGTYEPVPCELFYQYNCRFRPAIWRIPIYLYTSGNISLFKDASFSLNNGDVADVSFMPDLIFHYFKTASKLGDMFSRNVDILSYGLGTYEFRLTGVETLSNSFYYDNFKVFKNVGDEFDETGYVDCNVGVRDIYRLHKSGVFQYIGCPLYIDKDDNLYLGYFDDNSNRYRLSGVVKYKITDRRKFNAIVTKAIALSGFEYVDMCNYMKDVTPSVPYKI